MPGFVAKGWSDLTPGMEVISVFTESDKDIGVLSYDAFKSNLKTMTSLANPRCFSMTSDLNPFNTATAKIMMVSPSIMPAIATRTINLEKVRLLLLLIRLARNKGKFKFDILFLPSQR